MSRPKKRRFWEKWEKKWDSFWEVKILKLTRYFKPIYTVTTRDLYYPSRKNNGIFITKLFIAGGSHHFILPHGIVKAEHVETQRKIYNGSFDFTPELKASFYRVSIEGLTDFFQDAIPNSKIRDVMRSFGIPDDMAENAEMFCKALSYQFEAFVHSKTQEADDIVMLKYRQLLEDGDDGAAEPASAKYPGDRINVSAGREKKYRVNCYEAFQHTWIIENRGTVEWRGRRLFLTNSADIKLKIESVYLNVPALKPGEKTKIATGVEARGQEGTTEYKWIMIDDSGNNCFPDDSSLCFSVEVRFETETGK